MKNFKMSENRKERLVNKLIYTQNITDDVIS